MLACLAAPVWAAPPPDLALAQAKPQTNLTELMATRVVPVATAIDPDLLWLGEDGEEIAPDSQWRIEPGQRLVGRITLHGSRERDTYVVQVPIAAIDEVQVWYRSRYGGWKSAIAGDRVALSRWPFVGQFPAIPVLVREDAVDLIVTIANNGRMRAPVWIMADPAFREGQTRQANLSGLIMGLGLMVSVVCTIGGFLMGRRANWLLALLSIWTLLTVMCLNGYMAVWFTPEYPEFNDACKQFSGVVLAGLIVLMTAESLDQRYVRRPERWLKVLILVAGVAYAVVQVLWLPGGWRLPGAAAWTGITLVACIVLCSLSALRGGRYVRWIVAAVACFGLSVLLIYVRGIFPAALDVRAAAVGSLLFASALLFRQALFARERYGRDVLGRAAVAASRDPLTALLSYQGFQQAWDRALLKQGAGGGRSSIILFVLPGLEQISVDHGFVLTERAIVRFAACLQSVLGDTWSIARLSKTRFAAIATGTSSQAQVLALATHVLTQSTRMADSLGPAAEFDLKIVWTQRRLGADGLKALLFEMEEAARTLEAPKRIVMAP